MKNMKIKDERKIAEVGDIISCKAFGNMRIDEILSQEYFPATQANEEYWNIEFKHAGQYFHYKNYFDGGTVKQGTDKGKRIYNYLGSDVTDIFIKYGYKI